MARNRFCFCFSLDTGGNFIGLLVIATFIISTIEMVRYTDVFAWFILPTSSYGIASLFYIRILMQDSVKTRGDFFVFFTLCIALVYRVYEFVLYMYLPEYVEEICDLSDRGIKCKEWFSDYFIYLWLFNTALYLYFSFVLMEWHSEFEES